MISFHPLFPYVSFGSANEDKLPKKESEPLREFVYLDEVSLASLLASQKGEQTENVTVRSEEGSLEEVGGKVAANIPTVVSAETSSRFQTTNSSALQTSSKANAQSLFRELHKLEHLRLIRPSEIAAPAQSVTELFESKKDGAVFKASDLARGDLLEFRVKLSASWIFQINTMIAEFSDMFDESPTLFMDHVNFHDLHQAKNANKVILKLLAGLIPIEGTASEYAVVDYDGSEYIVHNDAATDMELDKTPLRIVGVTEHLAYWKDIRRILFANNEFTVLCRLSKPGLQKEWNSIKVADIFKEFAPDLANEIETSSKVAMAQSTEDESEGSIEPNVMQLMVALFQYKDRILGILDQPTSDDQLSQINKMLSDLELNGNTAEGQRMAFTHVRLILEKVTGREIDPTKDLETREQVRHALDLPLFPDLSTKSKTATPAMIPEADDDTMRLLDVEVVAIYW